MKSAGSVTRKSKLGSTSQPPVGMEDAVSLLKGLAGPQISKDAFIDPNQLHVEVKKIFKRLDVDGDGSISWWEWQSVLSGSLNGRNPRSKFVNPSETIAISLAAAQAALKGHGAGQINISKYIQEIPFSTTRPIVADSGYSEQLMQGRIPPLDDNGKTVDRLQTMVKSLRTTNSTLNSRLEKALTVSSIALSQTAAKALTFDRDDNECNVFDRNVSYFNLSRNQSSSSPVTIPTVALKSDRETSLELEISRLKALLAINSQMKTDKDVSKEQKRLKLVDEVDRRKHELEEAQRRRGEKMRAMIVLIRAFRTRVVPKFRKKVYRRNKAKLAILVRVVIVRHAYLKIIKKRYRSAVLIQKLFRGVKCRLALRLAGKRAIAIQRAYRGLLARQRVHSMRCVLAEILWSKRNAAAIRIQTVVRKISAGKFVAGVIHAIHLNKCATCIQALFRTIIPRKILKSLKLDKKTKKDQFEKEVKARKLIQGLIRRFIVQIRLKTVARNAKHTCAAIIIQSYFRRLCARVRYVQLLLRIRFSKAAVKIQALHRGR